MGISRYKTNFRNPITCESRKYFIFCSKTLRVFSRHALSERDMYVPCGNRTHNYSLGGYCYIHLTKRTGILFKYVYIMRIQPYPVIKDYL